MIKNVDNVKNYVNNRLLVERPGYSVIFTSESKNVVPISCDLCNYSLRSQDDEHTHEKFGCCNRCAITWVYPNITKWNDGWRPEKNDVSSCQPLLTDTRLTF